MAVPALQKRYGDDVIALTYHYDPPFRARGFSYKMWSDLASKADTTATPGGSWMWVAVNGQYPRESKPPNSQPGRRAGAVREYDNLQPVIEAQMQTEPGAYVDATAKLHGNTIDVTVKVDRLPSDGRARRLQIILSEDSIRQPGMDAVRFQTNVVRKIVGDSATGFGIALGPGASATVSRTLNVDSIEAELKEVNSPAAGRFTSGHWDGYQWSEIPPVVAYTIDKKRLHIAAFVQDEATGEVLDVVSVRVK